MLRSLLIGFLILSSLTSNGVGAQSIKSVNITTDMLLELFNTVAVHAGKVGVHSTINRASALSCANKASGVLPAKKEGAFFPCTSLDISKSDTLFGSCAAIWPEHCNYINLSLLTQKVFITYGQPINSGAHFCVSGLSPPFFMI